MQVLQSRSARSDSPMSNAAKHQLGLQPEKLRNVNKNEHLSSPDLHIGQDVVIKMLQASSSIQPLSPVYVCSQGVTI